MNSDICSLIGAELNREEFPAAAYSQAECGSDADEAAFEGARLPAARPSLLAQPVLNEPGLQTLSKAEQAALFVRRFYRTSC